MTHTLFLSDDVEALTEIDVSDFANGIIKVIDDEVYRKKISTNAQNLAEEKYSYEAYMKKTEAIYKVLEESVRS